MIAGGFYSGNELMPGMIAAVFVARGIVLMLWHWHASSRRFADI